MALKQPAMVRDLVIRGLIELRERLTWLPQTEVDADHVLRGEGHIERMTTIANGVLVALGHTPSPVADPRYDLTRRALAKKLAKPGLRGEGLEIARDKRRSGRGQA